MKKSLLASITCIMALSLSCLVPAANASITTELSTTISHTGGDPITQTGAGSLSLGNSVAFAEDTTTGYNLLTVSGLYDTSATLTLTNDGLDAVQILISYYYALFTYFSRASIKISYPSFYNNLQIGAGDPVGTTLTGSESFVITLGAGENFSLSVGAISLQHQEQTAVANVSSFTYQVVPIPGAFWLLGSGLAALVGLRRKFIA